MVFQKTLKWIKERVWRTPTTVPLQQGWLKNMLWSKDRWVHVSILFPISPTCRVFFDSHRFRYLASSLEWFSMDWCSLPRGNAKALVLLPMALEVPGSPTTCQPGRCGRYKGKPHTSASLWWWTHGDAGWSVGRPGYELGRTLSPGYLAGSGELEPVTTYLSFHWSTKGADPKAVESFQCPEKWGQNFLL